MHYLISISKYFIITNYQSIPQYLNTFFFFSFFFFFFLRGSLSAC